MRGLLGALLAVPVAFAVVVPKDFESEWKQAVEESNDRLFAHIGVDIPSGKSPDYEPKTLRFQLEVQQSEEICGFGNVTLNGQTLGQSLNINGDAWVGKGTVAADRSTLVSTWSFHCVKVNGIPDSQLMKFAIELADGKAGQDAGFAISFRQSGKLEILNIETDGSISDQVVANPNHQKLQPVEEDQKHAGMQEDLEELDYLRAQLREVKYLIKERERSLGKHANRYHREDIADCVSLKCIIHAIADSAKHAVHEIYGKIGGVDEFDDEEFEHEMPKFPEWPGHGHHGKNHTRHGNHTHPPPWKKPHHHLPICRYPPAHHGKPHHPPPHQSPPPHHHEGPPREHGPDRYHHEGPPDSHGPPHHHEGPPDFDGPPPPHHHGERPEFDGPDSDHPPPPPHHGERPPPPPHHGDHGPPEFDHPPPPPPRHGGHFDRSHGRPSRALTITKFTAAGFLLAFLLIALHRRTCGSPKRRAGRRERKEKKARRRAYRRVAHKHLITRILARVGSTGGYESQSESDSEWEEKEELLAGGDVDVEDGTGVIGEMREAVEVFTPASSDTASVTSSQAMLTPATSVVGERFDTLSQIGEGEGLPAYEDNDGSDISSVVADGFMYTPGSMQMPSQGTPGGCDILGRNPDVKN